MTLVITRIDLEGALRKSVKQRKFVAYRDTFLKKIKIYTYKTNLQLKRDSENSKSNKGFQEKKVEGPEMN